MEFYVASQPLTRDDFKSDVEIVLTGTITAGGEGGLKLFGILDISGNAEKQN